MGNCNGTGEGQPASAKTAKIRPLIEGAVTSKNLFAPNVAQLKGLLSMEQSTEDSKAILQVLTEGMLDASTPDQQRFWYLLILRYLMDCPNKKFVDLTAKKLGNMMKSIAMHRSEERIMSRGSDCLNKISSNPGMLL